MRILLEICGLILAVGGKFVHFKYTIYHKISHIVSAWREYAQEQI